MNIAQTIREQLGGNKFTAMTGARDFINHGNGLSFRLPRATGPQKITHIRINLVNDTYEIECMRIRGFTEPVSLSIDTGVHAANLQAHFTMRTGLATSL